MSKYDEMTPVQLDRDHKAAPPELVNLRYATYRCQVCQRWVVEGRRHSATDLDAFCAKNVQGGPWHSHACRRPTKGMGKDGSMLCGRHLAAEKRAEKEAAERRVDRLLQAVVILCMLGCAGCLALAIYVLVVAL